MVVPASQVNNFVGSGASIGPCGGSGGQGSNGGHGGTIGHNGGGGIGHNGGGGIGHNGGGGIGHNGGGGFNNGGNVGYNSGAGGWSGGTVSGAYCPPTSYVNYNNQVCATSNVTFFSGGSSWDCTPTYYNYGNNYYNNYWNVGFYYTGICNGVNYQLVYPDLDPGCNFVAFHPYRNKRVTILESACRSFHWRVVERRTWIPGAYVWFNGCRTWERGYYTWTVVEQSPIYDYWNCVSCYY